MDQCFAERILSVPPSFIREILKVSLDPEIISFAGGLPNRDYFPVAAIKAAAEKVLAEAGSEVLQYSNTEGLLSLREYISARYRKVHGLEVSPHQILITNGSQQGLDLLGKVMLNEGDKVLIEEPGYLGAIQSLSVYRPEFVPVPLAQEGIDADALQAGSRDGSCKLAYAVPTFQNPSGMSYSAALRKRVARIAEDNDFFIVEDDPYGALRFKGETLPPIYTYAPERTILLGSFSKIVAPGLRIGWVVAPQPVYAKLVIAKQAADLHTSGFSQHILAQFLAENDLEVHIQRIVDAYGSRCRMMLAAAKRLLPSSVQLLEPDGGMFIWGSLPAGISARKVFEQAVKERVVFVPGEAFYTRGGGEETFRLNYTCSGSEEIEEGMLRLARAIEACTTSR